MKERLIWCILTNRVLICRQKWSMRGKNAVSESSFRPRKANQTMCWVLCGTIAESSNRLSVKARRIQMSLSVVLTKSRKVLKLKQWLCWTMPRSIGAREFEEKIEEWEKLGLKIYFLPAYCPSLNKIEMLWQKIKYDWLSWEAYRSYKNLCQELDNILAQVGSLYYITFA